MKTNLFVMLAAFGLLASGSGCQKDVKSTRTFRLPDGDAANGKAAFIALKCIKCHTVDGVELPKPDEPGETTLALGGAVVNVRTYGDLLTSIAHPNNSLSRALPAKQRDKMTKSPMPQINDVMTVKQLVDLVAFIQPRYRRLEPLYEQDFPSLP